MSKITGQRMRRRYSRFLKLRKLKYLIALSIICGKRESVLQTGNQWSDTGQRSKLVDGQAPPERQLSPRVSLAPCQRILQRTRGRVSALATRVWRSRDVRAVPFLRATHPPTQQGGAPKRAFDCITRSAKADKAPPVCKFTYRGNRIRTCTMFCLFIILSVRLFSSEARHFLFQRGLHEKCLSLCAKRRIH